MAISVEFKDDEMQVQDRLNKLSVGLSKGELSAFKKLPEDHVMLIVLKKIAEASYKLGAWSVPGRDHSAEIRESCLRFDKHGR